MMVKNIRRLITKKWTDYTRINRTAANGDTSLSILFHEPQIFTGLRKSNQIIRENPRLNRVI